MQAMIRSSRRGLIAAILGASALILVVGLAFATNGGNNSSGESDPSDNDGATDLPLNQEPTRTTTPVVIDPVPAKPTEAPGSGGGSQPSVPPDAPVTSPPRPPVRTPAGLPPTPGGSPQGVITLPASELPPLPSGTQRVEAPIDDLDILSMDSFPPQYALHIQAGLPGGCARTAGFEASRSGSTITVKVYNSVPQGSAICTLIYGMYDLNINLGSDYQSGQTYTVVVNDKTITFTAQ